MPTTKSAAKRMRTSAQNRERNKSVKSRIASSRRKTDEAIAAGDKSLGQAAFREFSSVLDKAAKRGIIKKNTANRSKSRAHARLAAL